MCKWLPTETVLPIPDIFDFHRSIKDILNPNPINRPAPDWAAIALFNVWNSFLQIELWDHHKTNYSHCEIITTDTANCLSIILLSFPFFFFLTNRSLIFLEVATSPAKTPASPDPLAAFGRYCYFLLICQKSLGFQDHFWKDCRPRVCVFWSLSPPSCLE